MKKNSCKACRSEKKNPADKFVLKIKFLHQKLFTPLPPPPFFSNGPPLSIYRGKHLLTKPWYICTVFTLAQKTEVSLSSITITMKSNSWRQILKSTLVCPLWLLQSSLFIFLFLSCKLRSQVFSGFIFAAPRSRGECD